MTQKFDTVNDDVHAMKEDFNWQANGSRDQMNELRMMQLQIQQDMKAMQEEMRELRTDIKDNQEKLMETLQDGSD